MQDPRLKIYTMPKPSAMNTKLSVVMMGASGAVGGEALKALLALKEVDQVTLLNRKNLSGVQDARLHQHAVDVLEPSSYAHLLGGHTTAICTLGVGQPSQMSKAEFVRIDKDAVLAFATACKQAGVRHFELLGSVGANATSASLYLRTKGELEQGLLALGFHRLSLFQPSMILTPTNRYGVQQAITLAVWPHLQPVLAGPLRKYRGIAVETLGAAFAHNLLQERYGNEVLHWDDFTALAR
jgi:uncharacterized protein YbjT (DUF2867 family)